MYRPGPLFRRRTPRHGVGNGAQRPRRCRRRAVGLGPVASETFRLSAPSANAALHARRAPRRPGQHIISTTSLSVLPPGSSTPSWGSTSSRTITTNKPQRCNNVNTIRRGAGTRCGRCVDDDSASDATDAPTNRSAPEAKHPRPRRHRLTGGTAVPPAIGEGTSEGGTIRLWLNGEADTPTPLRSGRVQQDPSRCQGRARAPAVDRDRRTADDGAVGERRAGVVEFGNTQVQAFEAAGALTDLSEHAADLGGGEKFFGTGNVRRRAVRRSTVAPAS